MSSRRSYDQACSLAQALDCVGERWTLLVVRELLIRPCRYSDLLAALPGLGTNLLASRLKQMEADGLLRKNREPGRRPTYVLTDLGLALEPVLLELVRWQWRRRVAQDSSIIRNHWALLGLKAFFDPGRAQDISMVVQFLAEPVVHIGILHGRLRWWLDDVGAPRTDLCIDASIADLFAALRAGHKITDNRVGTIDFKGDPKLLARFAHCFPSK